MSVTSARAQLKNALGELKIKWDLATQNWDDPASRRFEKDFLRPLEPAVRKSCSAMEQMAELVIRARRDCE